MDTGFQAFPAIHDPRRLEEPVGLRRILLRRQEIGPGSFRFIVA
jgi:hypothetical protein